MSNVDKFPLYQGPRFLNADEKIHERPKLFPDFFFRLVKPVPIREIKKPVYCYKNRCDFSGTADEVSKHLLNFHKCICACPLCGQMFRTKQICRKHIVSCKKRIQLASTGHPSGIIFKPRYS